ncbi:restriction endonuclease subunit S [Brevibacillus centrosporus]|uniref:restriction endonuclease subunit S n=1 Tax=Brevibacillus centrosporus TaxID=54910 RepID=UPI003B0103B6
MTPQDLKNSILQMAIQGKLVEQRPEDGNAEELYKQIQTEKQKLINTGIIKNEKTLPEITEDEMPFDIPENWKWIRLRSIVYNRGQETPTELFSYIDIGSIDNKKQRLNTEENLIEAKNAPSRARKVVELGDILYSTVRPYLHNMCIIDRQFTHKPIASTGFAAMTCYEGIYNKFLFFYLMSPAFDNYANDKENAKGVAYPAINDGRLYRAIVPLPPLAEQKRIVDKIEELLPYIDGYELAWSKLEEFNKRFPGDMQKSILQMAIQGKLVEQHPEEGNGEELYQQIQAEKQRLIKAGTIKKEKLLPEIKEDEIPFEIPDSWKWVRLSNICKSIADGDHQAPPQVPSGVPFLVISNLSSGVIDFSNTRHVPQEYFNNLSSERVAESGDLIFTVTGSYGIPVKVDCDDRFCFQRHMALLKTLINNEYLFYLLKSPVVKEQCDNVATGTAQKTVGLNSLRNIIVPLPPLAEQKRIVAKLERILPLCEKLK